LQQAIEQAVYDLDNIQIRNLVEILARVSADVDLKR
jgi:hypothetical protein